MLCYLISAETGWKLKNPRQIERVIAGAVFGVSIVYDVTDPAQVEEDLWLRLRRRQSGHADAFAGC